MRLWWLLALLPIGLLTAAVLSPRLASAPFFHEIFFVPKNEATVIFVGDIMLDRFVRQKANEFGRDHTFSGVKEFLASADFVAGNLEGPVTATSSQSSGTTVGDLSNMRFTFPTSAPTLLKELGFGLLSIGNNHMLDFGREGAEETKQYLTEAGISFVGDPLREAPDIVVKEIGGLRLAFIAYNQFFGQTVEDVRQAVIVAHEHHFPDAIIVLAHWGEEYLPEPPERTQEVGRSFIDAGADLVIGSHPHVVQPFEDYHGGRIYYSLGNFAFDQYWNEEVRCGRAVTATFTEKRITYIEQEIGMERDGRTVIGCR